MVSGRKLQHSGLAGWGARGRVRGMSWSLGIEIPDGVYHVTNRCLERRARRRRRARAADGEMLAHEQQDRYQYDHAQQKTNADDGDGYDTSLPVIVACRSLREHRHMAHSTEISHLALGWPRWPPHPILYCGRPVPRIQGGVTLRPTEDPEGLTLGTAASDARAASVPGHSERSRGIWLSAARRPRVAPGSICGQIPRLRPSGDGLRSE